MLICQVDLFATISLYFTTTNNLLEHSSAYKTVSLLTLELIFATNVHECITLPLKSNESSYVNLFCNAKRLSYSFWEK